MDNNLSKMHLWFSIFLFVSTDHYKAMKDVSLDSCTL